MLMFRKFIILFFILCLFPLKALALNSNRINVAFTIDNNYPVFTLLAINSILKNNKSNSEYHFYIVEDNLTKHNKLKMKKYVESRNQKIDFFHIDTKVIDKGSYFFTFSNRITPIGMARIMLPEILPENVHRVLYLDGDILVTGDIKELFNYDLKGNPAGMIKNVIDEKYDICKPKVYHNSGVILMDVDNWRKNNISEKMLSFLNKHKKNFIYSGVVDGSVFLYPDQDLINIVLNKKITTMPLKWNNQTVGYYSLVRNSSGIHHFIGSSKPWDFPKRRSIYVKRYYKYWKSSGLRWYMYYYFFKAEKQYFVAILKHKISRYKLLFKKTDRS